MDLSCLLVDGGLSFLRWFPILVEPHHFYLQSETLPSSHGQMYLTIVNCAKCLSLVYLLWITLRDCRTVASSRFKRLSWSSHIINLPSFFLLPSYSHVREKALIYRISKSNYKIIGPYDLTFVSDWPGCIVIVFPNFLVT